jgi:hypothetical protein
VFLCCCFGTWCSTSFVLLHSMVDGSAPSVTQALDDKLLSHQPRLCMLCSSSRSPVSPHHHACFDHYTLQVAAWLPPPPAWVVSCPSHPLPSQSQHLATMRWSHHEVTSVAAAGRWLGNPPLPGGGCSPAPPGGCCLQRRASSTCRQHWPHKSR